MFWTCSLIIAVFAIFLALNSHFNIFISQQALEADLSDVFFDPGKFLREYELMEREFKIYVYPDVGPKEDFFFKNLNKSRFLTGDPNQAHYLFIPISTHLMQFEGTSYNENMMRVEKYARILISKNPYRNQNQDAAHFFVNCHHGLMWTKGLTLLGNAIQVVCTSWDSLEFNSKTHIVIPAQEAQSWAEIETRKIRLNLSDYSEDGVELIRNFCSCPTTEYFAACIAESILEECVPVVSLSNLDLPFKNILDWSKFSAIAPEGELHTVKNITGEKFINLHCNLLKVQKYFKWNSPPIKFDAFHMAMYELWIRREV